MTARRAHRLIAFTLGTFIAIHLANHVALIISPEAHHWVMTKLRLIYRPIIVETILIALFALQIGIGIAMIKRRPWPRTRWGRAQAVSGIILALFLIQHVVAAIATRVFQTYIDTDVYWAASVVSMSPVSWYFIPYYLLGCISLFVHIAAALRHKRRQFAPWIIGAGVVFSVTIVAFLVLTVTLPPPYNQYLNVMYGLTPTQ